MNEKTQRVGIEISGPKLKADKFIRAVRDFLDIIEDVATQVSKNRNAVSWLISVESGSARILARPEVAEDKYKPLVPNIFEAIKNGAVALESHAEIPEFFSETSLEKMRDLASIVDGKRHEIDTVKIIVDDSATSVSHHTFANVEDILGPKSTALGSVEGRLEMITLRGGYMGVYDDLTDRRIRCDFPSEILELIKPALGKRVSVFGVVSYRRDGEPITIRVQEFKVLSKEGLPTFDDVKGILKDA